MPANINDYIREVSCEYKGRVYHVRDNGAVYRIPKEGYQPSLWEKEEDKWTFGRPDVSGYLFIGPEAVHRIVCWAFHGAPVGDKNVADHIDTNKQNNRPENLRWVTKMENLLDNTFTMSKIETVCGSKEAFIEDPSLLFDRKPKTPNNSGLRPVNSEEAEAYKHNWMNWGNKPVEERRSNGGGGGQGEWMFSMPQKSWKQHKAEIEEMNRRIWEEEHALKDSLTPGAKQLNWVTPTEFPLCPVGGQERTLQAYLDNLVKGKVFTRTKYGDGGLVLECGINEAENALYVLSQKGDEESREAVKPWALCRVTLKDGFFVHENKHTFFKKDDGQKNFTIAMGREWTGGDVFDDYCPS